eukprot:m51a1_g404 putative glutamate receptor -like isoform x1 (587) ;mRNA; f:726429-733004
MKEDPERAAALASPYNWSSPPCKLLAANATAHPPDDTLVVGVLYSLQRSATLEACAPLAQEAHELGHYNVSLVLFDDKDLSSMGPVAAELFSAIPVVTVIGGDSSRITMTLLDGNATHPGLTASGIPLISGLSTSPMLSDKSKYPRFMRTCTSVALSSLAMVQMFSKYGITRVVGMGNDDSYGQGGVQKIVMYAARATPPVNVSDVLKRVRAAVPQAIVLYCGSMTCFPVLEQARLMGMLQKPYAWILGNGLNTYSKRVSIALIYPLLAQAINNNTVVMGVATAVDVSPVSVKYTKDILACLGEAELVNPFWSLFEYDAGLAWVHAAKKIIAAGQDPHNRSLFYSTLIALEFQGASSWVSFDENGDRFATSAIFRWCPGNDNLATIGNWTASGGGAIDPRWAPWSPAVATGTLLWRLWSSASRCGDLRGTAAGLAGAPRPGMHLRSCCSSAGSAEPSGTAAAEKATQPALFLRASRRLPVARGSSRASGGSAGAAPEGSAEPARPGMQRRSCASRRPSALPGAAALPAGPQSAEDLRGLSQRSRSESCRAQAPGQRPAGSARVSQGSGGSRGARGVSDCAGEFRLL